MRHTMLTGAVLGVATSILFGASGNAANFTATLSGFDEIGGPGPSETGAIFSRGKATLSLTLNGSARTITFKLTYSGLSSPVTQAHIHFGKEHVAGGVMVFFCSNLASPPPGTKACPPTGTVTGTITPKSVIGPTVQNVPPGDFDKLVAALASSTAYGNIHTTKFPAGEIRGQISPAPKTVTIHMLPSLQFEPESQTVKAGDTVKWVDDGGTHTATPDPGQPDPFAGSPTLNEGQNYSVVISGSPRTIKYHCKIHGALMSGEIVVTQ